MTEEEIEHQCRIDGYELVVGVFLNAPLRRSEFRDRFADLENAARKNNAHAATIEVLRSVRERLTD